MLCSGPPSALTRIIYSRKTLHDYAEVEPNPNTDTDSRPDTVPDPGTNPDPNPPLLGIMLH